MAYQNIYYTVVKGDCLSVIAQKVRKQYGTSVTWQEIYSWNRSIIGSNPNLIYPGQRLVVGSQYVADSSGGSSGGTTTTTNTVTPSSYTPSNAGTVSITNFGFMANNDGTLFVKWSWTKANTKNYNVEWQYRTKDGLWFIGQQHSVTNKEDTWNYPSYCDRVCVKVQPVSENTTVNNQQTVYWTANWTSWQGIDIKEKPDPIAKPSTPKVEIKDFTLTVDMDNIDETNKQIQLEIVKDDSTTFKTATITVVKSAISYSCAVNAGGRYKVRARGVRNGEYGDWSDYSDDIGTVPVAVTGTITMVAESKTEIRMSWNSVKNADTYDVEYCTDKKYFDVSDNTTTKSGIEGTTTILTGLESGQTYYARVRAVNENGKSGWSAIKSCVIGAKPIAPTTWSSTTTAVVGEDVYLYWVHNSADGSSERYATICITGEVPGGSIVTRESGAIKNEQINDEEHKDDTKMYSLTKLLSQLGFSYRQGIKIRWKVKTSGITNEWSDYSVEREIDIYAPPTLALNIQDKDGRKLNTITSFPFYVKGLAGPNTQVPNSYHLSVIANESYETTDRIGNPMFISKGDEIFSKYYDSNNDTLLVEMRPDLIDLENNIPYTMKCVVSMDSGLTAESTVNFDVSWTDILYMPNAEISLNKDTVSTYIRPYVMHQVVKRQMLVLKIGQEGSTEKEYVPTLLTNQNANDVINAEILPNAYYRDVENPYTFTDPDTGISETDDRIYAVFSGTNAAGTRKEYYEYVGEEELIADVTLAVYRREFDGSFTEIGSGLENSKNTFVVDPHPALDYARYRIVVTDNKTGAISFYDTPAYPIHEKGIIIQWDEEWTNFDVTDESGDELTTQPQSGSFLRLLYNIDTSDKHTYDAELVNYAGRKHPVSYYGTALSTNATWNLEIPRSDKETLYALRRLAIYLGDVYVREPSGTGYWAAINISYSQTHKQVTIPVTIDVVRVEGGV